MIIKRDTRNNCRKIEVVMPDGKVIKFATVKECCKELGITVYYVRRALRSGEEYNGILFRDTEG